MVAIDEEVNKQGQPQGGETPVVTTFGHRSALSTDESIGSGKKTSNVQGGELESDDSSVDEEIDTNDYKSPTDQAYDRIVKEVFANNRLLKYDVSVHLSFALFASASMATNGVPALLGQGPYAFPSNKAAEAMVTPSVVGALSFYTTVMLFLKWLAPYFIDQAIRAEREKVGTAAEALNPMQNGDVENVIDRAQNSLSQVDYDAMLKKNHGPDVKNMLYMLLLMGVAGTLLFSGFGLADVTTVMAAELEQDKPTVSKLIDYGVETIEHGFGGLIFPAFLVLMDQTFRGLIDRCVTNSGLKPVQLPDHLALDNMASLAAAVLLVATLVESGLSLQIANSLIENAIVAFVAGGVIPAISITLNNYFDKKPSAAANHVVSAFGSALATVFGCCGGFERLKDLVCPPATHQPVGSTDG